jgi:thioredoxin reductase (NADPH)
MKEYDLIVIGAGFAGYSAAMYAKRYNLSVLIIAELRGGLITTTDLVENYPGYTSITGQDIAKKLEEHAVANGAEVKDDQVSEIKKEDKKFVIKTAYFNKEYKSKCIVLATGTKHRHLNVAGEKEFSGKGVSYCATCDANFYKDKTVAIVGGSDGAAKEALILSQVAKKVYMLIRSKLRAEPINQKLIQENKKIEIVEGVNVKEIKGKDNVGSVLLDNKKEMKVEGVFIAIGQIPQSELAKQLKVDLNEREEIKIDRLSKTSVEGVFAAGDVTDSSWKQGIISAAEGSAAGHSAFEYVSKNF